MACLNHLCHFRTQIPGNQPELLQRCLQVFHNLQGNHTRCGQVVAVTTAGAGKAVRKDAAFQILQAKSRNARPRFGTAVCAR